MNLYLISKIIPPDLEQMESAVVAAQDERRARLDVSRTDPSTHPDDDSWMNPKRSSCQLIGTAGEDIPPGIVLSASTGA